MPVNTEIEARKKRRKRQAVLGTAVSGVLSLACAGVLAALCFLPNLPWWAAAVFIALAALRILSIGCSMVVLYQRLQEIEGGESDAAAEY